jgi:hypothetical protein
VASKSAFDDDELGIDPDEERYDELAEFCPRCDEPIEDCECDEEEEEE